MLLWVVCGIIAALMWWVFARFAVPCPSYEVGSIYVWDVVAFVFCTLLGVVALVVTIVLLGIAMIATHGDEMLRFLSSKIVTLK